MIEQEEPVIRPQDVIDAAPLKRESVSSGFIETLRALGTSQRIMVRIVAASLPKSASVRRSPHATSRR